MSENKKIPLVKNSAGMQILHKIKLFWIRLGREEIPKDRIKPYETITEKIKRRLLESLGLSSDTGGFDIPVSIKKVANKYFGPFVDKHKEFFEYKQLKGANIDLYPRTYASLIIMASLISFFIFIPIVAVFLALYSPTLSTPKKLVISVIASVFGSVCFFIFLYTYPFYIYRARGKNMDYNTPFAITHMAAISSSGVSPYRIFKLMSHETDFGEIATECKKIAAYTEILGLDILTAMKTIMEQCPSRKFVKILSGMSSIIESGGNLRRFLEVEAEQALVEYSAEREKYIKSLSTLADLYIAIMIAAPLFLVATLSALSMLGGTYGGYTPDQLLQMAVWFAIPGLNILYFIFLELTQPEI